MDNRSVPSSTLLSQLTYWDLPKACEWLKHVFGFSEHYRFGEPVGGIQMYLGSAYIMLAGPRPGRQSPAALGGGSQMLTIFVDEVDVHCKRAVGAGAKIWEELHETFYGERQYGIEDLDGHQCCLRSTSAMSIQKIGAR